MENEHNQQTDNEPVVVNPIQDDSPPIAGPNLTQPPHDPSQQPAPVKKLSDYIGTGFVILILLVIFLPNSSFAQALAWPVIILGLVAGVKFFIGSVKSSRTSNPIVRTFIIFTGLGMGIVIFVVCLIAGAVIGFSKDPHPQGCG